MQLENDQAQYNCSERYQMGEPNVDPVSVESRYPTYILLDKFTPNTLLVIRIFMILWLTVGLFGNSLSLIIWSSKPQRRKNTSAIYLTALSLTDFLLILCLINYHMYRFWGVHGIDRYPGMCEIYQGLSFFLQYYSTILVFGFTLERYLAVCFPFKRHKLCTAKRAVIAVVILALICLGPTLFQAALWGVDGEDCDAKVELVHLPSVQGALMTLEILFSLVVPLAALVFNILLLREMRRLVRSTAVPAPTVQATGGSNGDSGMKLARHKSSSVSVRSEASKPRESSGFVATTVMLVILSFYLIACAVPPGVFFLAQFNWAKSDMCLTDEAMRTDPTWHVVFRQEQAKQITDVLCASHYALNFFIYLFTSKAFRMQAFWILSCNCKKLKSLTNPTPKETWMFPRRTAPRPMRNTKEAKQEEQRTLISELEGSDSKQPFENGNR